MSELWTPPGTTPQPTPDEPDGLPVVESTLYFACGHTGITTDREALRAVDSVNRGQGHVTAMCGHDLCRTERRITQIRPKQKPPEPEPEEWDIEKGLWDFEVEHGYRNPATGRRRPEHLGRDFI